MRHAKPMPRTLNPEIPTLSRSASRKVASLRSSRIAPRRSFCTCRFSRLVAARSLWVQRTTSVTQHVDYNLMVSSCYSCLIACSSA